MYKVRPNQIYGKVKTARIASFYIRAVAVYGLAI